MATGKSKHEQLIGELEKKVLELVPFRVEHGTLTEKVKVHEGDLGTVRGEREALERELANRDNELGSARAELEERAQRIEQLDADLQAASQEHDRLNQQLAQCQNDLDLARKDLDRVTSERQSAFDSAERQTKTVAKRDSAIKNLRDQLDAETKSNKEALALAERNHLEERNRLTAELAAIRVQHQELESKHQSAETTCKQLEKKHQDLATASAKRQSEYEALLSAERSEHQRLADEVITVRANAASTARAAEHLISVDLNPPEATLVPAHELEAVRVQAEELKYKLDEAEYLYRMVAQTLDGIGIQIDLPVRRRDKAVKS